MSIMLLRRRDENQAIVFWGEDTVRHSLLRAGRWAPNPTYGDFHGKRSKKVQPHRLDSIDSIDSSIDSVWSLILN